MSKFKGYRHSQMIGLARLADEMEFTKMSQVIKYRMFSLTETKYLKTTTMNNYHYLNHLEQDWDECYRQARKGEMVKVFELRNKRRENNPIAE